jgi:hypothetical protein
MAGLLKKDMAAKRHKMQKNLFPNYMRGWGVLSFNCCHSRLRGHDRKNEPTAQVYDFNRL